MADADAARARAEARRQKILARQQDRLTAITGTYASAGALEEKGGGVGGRRGGAHLLESAP